VSLLIDGTAGLKDPLTGPRVSILARAVRADQPELKARFLARHAGAKIYAGFTDFHVYRLEVTRAHFVAGFGRIHWIEAAEIIGGTYGDGPAPAKATAAKPSRRKSGKPRAAKTKSGKPCVGANRRRGSSPAAGASALRGQEFVPLLNGLFAY